MSEENGAATPENAQGAPAGAPEVKPEGQQTGQSKGQVETKPEGGNPFGFPEGTPDAKPDVPETYQFTLPEGLTISDELSKQFTAIAHEAKLTQKQADSLVKMHADIMMNTQKQAEELKDQWTKECEQQGLSKPENLQAAKLAVDTFGGGEVMNILIESGVAFNPSVQRFLQNIGKLLQEDTPPDGKPAGASTSAADLLFNNSKY